MGFSSPASRFLIVQIVGKLKGRWGTLFHGSLNGFLVPAEGFALDGVAKVAVLDIEQNLYLPRLERVTVHGSAYQLLQKLIEPVEHYLAVWALGNHIQTTIGRIGFDLQSASHAPPAAGIRENGWGAAAMSDPKPAGVKFDEPRLALNRIYTKAGDQGQTHLAGGQRISKDSPRIECYGTVDELNAFTGMARLTAVDTVPELAAILLRVQHELFNLGSILATRPEDVHPNQARITSAEIEQLEREIDAANAGLVPLRSFVLPGGSRLNAELHACRTICRRAERTAVSLAREESIPPETIRYLNRLSDAFFVWSRDVNRKLGVPETLWEPNQASSGRRPD